MHKRKKEMTIVYTCITFKLTDKHFCINFHYDFIIIIYLIPSIVFAILNSPFLKKFFLRDLLYNIEIMNSKFIFLRFRQVIYLFLTISRILISQFLWFIIYESFKNIAIFFNNILYKYNIICKNINSNWLSISK